MYIVELQNGSAITEIHGEIEKLKSGNIVKGVNTIDSFSFSMLPNNIGFDKIHDYKTLVSVYNDSRGRYDFQGRALYSTVDMDTKGRIVKEVICENFFGFLCDSVQDYVEERNWTPVELFTHILTVHNSQVESYKQFHIGEVTVSDPNDNVYIGIQRENTWKTLQDKLVDKLGGELQFRVVDGSIYLDYLQQIGRVTATPIELGHNMKAIFRENDPTEIVTRFIPFGSKLSDDSEERLTIESVNEGIKYIDDQDAIEAFGIRVGYEIFDDITTPEALLTRGQQWIIARNRMQVRYKITALDLSLIGLYIDEFQAGNYYPLMNSLLGVDDVARIVKQNINICDEMSSTIEVGDNFKLLSDVNAKKEADTIYRIESARNELKNQISYTKDTLLSQMETRATQIINDAESIILSAMESYVKTGDYESFQQETASQLRMLAEELTIKFTQATESIGILGEELQSRLNVITKYFTFDINGLTIGAVDNPNKVVIDNDEISIMVNGVDVQRFNSNGEALIQHLKVMKSQNILGYITEMDSAGNVNTYWGGD